MLNECQQLGILHLLVEGVFSALNDSLKNRSEDRPAYSYKLKVQVIEVYGELARDLVRNQSDGLITEEDVYRGTVVKGATFHPADNADSCLELLRQVKTDFFGSIAASAN